MKPRMHFVLWILEYNFIFYSHCYFIIFKIMQVVFSPNHWYIKLVRIHELFPGRGDPKNIVFRRERVEGGGVASEAIFANISINLNSV